MQGRVRADGHVRAAEVVVDGAHHAHDVEGRVLLGRLPVDQAWEQGSVWEASDHFHSLFRYYLKKWRLSRDDGPIPVLLLGMGFWGILRDIYSLFSVI